MERQVTLNARYFTLYGSHGRSLRKPSFRPEVRVWTTSPAITVTVQTEYVMLFYYFHVYCLANFLVGEYGYGVRVATHLHIIVAYKCYFTGTGAYITVFVQKLLNQI